MQVRVINFTFILMNEVLLFWMLSESNVKTSHIQWRQDPPAPPVPSGTEAEHAPLLLPLVGTEILWQTEIFKNIILQWQFWFWGQTASWDEATETDQARKGEKAKDLQPLVLPAALTLSCSSLCNLCHSELEKQGEIYAMLTLSLCFCTFKRGTRLLRKSTQADLFVTELSPGGRC